MVSFERGLQAAGLDPSRGLPYWDWTDGQDDELLEPPRLAREHNWLNSRERQTGQLTHRYYFDYLNHVTLQYLNAFSEKPPTPILIMVVLRG